MKKFRALGAFRTLGAVASLITLSACGGGGSEVPGTASSPAPVGATAAPTPTPAPAPSAPAPSTPPPTTNVIRPDVKFGTDFPVAAAACASADSFIETNASLAQAVWLRCSTGQLPVAIMVSSTERRIVFSYGNTSSGIVEFTSDRNDPRSSIVVDYSRREVTIKHTALTLDRDRLQFSATGGLPTTPTTVSIEGTLKF